MLNETQKLRINKIYKDYQDTIKPLIFYIERKYHKFPNAILNEIRDVFDHISRCYRDDAKDEYINDNIIKAENHFTRVKLDAYKYVSDIKRKDFVLWKRKYNKYDLQGIDNGNFWKYIIELEEEAEEKFALAKEEESKDIEKSYELFSESVSQYNTINKLIKEKRGLIIKEKIKYQRITMSNKIVGFVIGIISSIIAAIIYSNFF